MNLIFGTDFSESSRQAGDVAAALANRLKDTLWIVHALEPYGLEPLSPAAQTAIVADLEQRLDQECERLKPAQSRIRRELLTGRPDEILIQKAQVSDTRLVVVSSLGRGKPGRWLIGSVAERVAEGCRVPTLIVRESPSLTEWCRNQRPLRILCAFDHSAPAEAALSYVRQLRLIGPCEVIVAYANWPPADKHRLGVPGPVTLESNRPEIQAVLERDLREHVATVLGNEPVELRVEPGWGRPDLRLIELARQERADLILTGTHQRKGLNRLWHASTSRGLLLHAPTNVLVVPKVAAPTHQGIPSVRRVLVATDFSELGDHAIPQAYAALPLGGQIHLITVVPPWELPGPLVPHYSPRRLNRKQHQQLLAESLQKLKERIPAEAEARGITTEIEVVQARDVADGIQHAAERMSADLICVGSHGRSGLSKAILGSVAGGVLSRTHRPVLVVRAPQTS
jgi:nucleotide-binding universal stress UspA family protein